jgi:hypothetical protein
MTMIERLLALANELAENSAGSLTLKRRAVSTACYAVFRALAELCTGELLGVRTDKRSEDYVRVYRSLEHGTLKSAFRAAPLNNSDALRKIGDRVVRLQSERILSDYVPSQALYTVDECRDLVRSAESVLLSIAELSHGDRRSLAVHLLFKGRPA